MSRWNMQAFSHLYVQGCADECWEWHGRKDKDGYGVFYHVASGRDVRAHRHSYELHKGPVPAGLMVLHSCDNPPCINPKHLWLGTAVDNVEDRTKKNRSARGDSNGARTKPESRARGERHGSKTVPDSVRRGGANGMRIHAPKLTAKAATEIRQAIGSYSDIGDAYGVTKSMVWRIKSGLAWRGL